MALPMMNGSWSERQVAELLHLTLSIKKWFIETDEFDHAERRLLNFGHTWGHAVETATSFKIPHGHAVAIGMLASICFTKNESGTTRLKKHCIDILKSSIRLSQLKEFDRNMFLEAFKETNSTDNYHLIVQITKQLGVNE